MQDNDTPIIDGTLLSDCEFTVIYQCQFIKPVLPSKRKFKRDFIIEYKRSFEIKGIYFHSWKNDLYLAGEPLYDGNYLDLKAEPWNEYDENAIAIYLYGRKLGYVAREDTEEVSDIMLFSKHYKARFRRDFFDMCEITYSQEFHDINTMPYQTDLGLTTSSINENFDKYAEFIRACVGHVVYFDNSFLTKALPSDYDDNMAYKDLYNAYLTDKEKAFLKNHVSLRTDMQSTIGFISNTFIKKQFQKTQMVGFIEDVNIDEDKQQVGVKMRLCMEKSVVNKNYQKAYQALENYFVSFGDGGTYSIPFADLAKMVPRKTCVLSAYEPLVKYLKEYHAIQLIIE